MLYYGRGDDRMNLSQNKINIAVGSIIFGLLVLNVIGVITDNAIIMKGIVFAMVVNLGLRLVARYQ
jgi:hypothetical protein